MLPCFFHAQRSKTLLNPSFPLKLPRFPAIQTRTSTTSPTSLPSLCKGPEHLRQIHARLILHGVHRNPALCSKLIDCYAEHGLTSLAKHVVDSASDPNTDLHNALLRNLTALGDFQSALFVYQDMVLRKSMCPDEETYPFVLDSCSCLLDVKNGKKIHGRILKLGFEPFCAVAGALVEMYRSFGEKVKESFGLFVKMKVGKVVNLLRSSVDLGSLKAVHCAVVVCGLCEDLSVNTALLSVYLKLRALEEARLVFEKMPEKDSIVWNVMINGYSRYGFPQKSVELLRYMVKSNVRADLYTALPVISSIRQLKSVELGKEMHAYVIRNVLDYQVSVHNALIDMYCGCSCLSYARKIFDLLANKTLISWSSIIKGYINDGQSLEALSLFAKMRLDWPGVDFITIINVLPACVNLGALEQVKYLHGYSLKFGLNMLASVNTALLVSYAKCGCIEMARKLFDEENINKDIITWNSMISAYAKHGDWSECFKLYHQMKQMNLKPDELTFLGLLIACVNSGLVKEGREVFKEMMETYTCRPNQEHYACMVNLLGRAGHVKEARDLVKSMPFQPDARVWGPLLSACKMHSDAKLAEFAAENLLATEPRNAGNYVLLSNIYAAAGKWDGVAKMRNFLRDKGLKKTPGCSWLETNGHVHEFRVADRSHPKADDIYTMLGKVELEIKETRDKFEKNVSNADFIHFWSIS